MTKKVLLPTNKCKIWLNHLQTVLENRRRGAKKAVATRRARAQLTQQSHPPPLAPGHTLQVQRVSPLHPCLPASGTEEMSGITHTARTQLCSCTHSTSQV